MHAERSEREWLRCVGVDQQNLAVENQVVGSRKRFRDPLPEVVDLKNADV